MVIVDMELKGEVRESSRALKHYRTSQRLMFRGCEMSVLNELGKQGSNKDIVALQADDYTGNSECQSTLIRSSKAQ